jgi:hypothetical protein
VDGHPVHHQAFRRYAQRCGDLLVDRLEEEGIQRGWSLAAFRLEGEDGSELVVAYEEDPVGAEGQSPADCGVTWLIVFMMVSNRPKGRQLCTGPGCRQPRLDRHHDGQGC